MSNFSTLIYLVNNFQVGLNTSNQEVVCNETERLFTAIDETRFEPSESSIENILNFARSYEVMETANAGYVEMILN